MKFLLYCFEWMSSLKINYHKSELQIFGVDEEERQLLANMLNCKKGQVPMKYLGFPISDRALGPGAFKNIVEKMRKKLQPWKGKHLSYGGRLILTNSTLSSMPIYMMGMFNLPETIHSQMDTIRGRFFWRWDREKFKYHMVKWHNVCLPKDFGELGIINTMLLNDALMLKWTWRLYREEEDNICCQLLRAKYLRNKTLLQHKGTSGSQFWRGVNKTKHLFSWGHSLK